VGRFWLIWLERFLIHSVVRFRSISGSRLRHIGSHIVELCKVRRCTTFLQVLVAELRIAVGSAVERQSLRRATVCNRSGAAISLTGQDRAFERGAEISRNQSSNVPRGEANNSSFVRIVLRTKVAYDSKTSSGV